MCATFYIGLRVKHIKGRDDILADLLSRQKFKELGELMWDVIPMHSFLCLGMPSSMNALLTQGTVEKGLHPHTRNQYIRQFKLFLAFVLCQRFCSCGTNATIVSFLQFLATNSLSFRVINNYLSALKFYFARYRWDWQILEDHVVERMMRGIQYSGHVVPTQKGFFSLHQISKISQLWQSFESLLTYRCAYLLAFYGLFRISILGPKSPSMFDSSLHLL